MSFVYKIIICLVFTCYLFTAESKQNFQILIDKGLLLYVNKNYAKDVHYYCGNVNATHVSVSADYTATRYIGNDADLRLLLYRYSNNNYQKIPINININLCKMVTKNSYLEGISDLLNHGNITPCDVKPGYYYLKNYVPDLDFPSITPAGKYRLKFFITIKEEDLFTMDWFVNLVRNT